MSKIIVLGATGTLGLPVAKALKNAGHDVIAAGFSNKNAESYFNKLGMEYQQIDITKEDSFDNLPNSSVDCVVNYAGCLPAMMSENHSNTLYPDTIIRGTINILEYMLKVGCKKLVYPQSVFDVNHLMGTPEPIDPDAERKNYFYGDHAIYVICKNAILDIMKYYENEYGIKCVIVRTPGVYHYGPKPFILKNEAVKIKSERIIIEKAKRGETIEIWGDPNRVLESVCADDYAEVVRLCVEKDNAKGIYNAGCGGSTLEERVRGICEVFNPENKKSKIVYKPEKMNCFQYVLDIEKTKSELGYAPKYSWTDYLKKLKYSMENQPDRELWGSFEDYYDMIK